MLILSSAHIHETTESVGNPCSGCVQHQCSGHLSELTTTIHACVLCQFLTITFVAAATCAVVLYNKTYSLCRIRKQASCLTGTRGIVTLRAPPAV